jgi:hypothetical protein
VEAYLSDDGSVKGATKNDDGTSVSSPIPHELILFYVDLLARLDLKNARNRIAQTLQENASRQLFSHDVVSFLLQYVIQTN